MISLESAQQIQSVAEEVLAGDKTGMTAENEREVQETYADMAEIIDRHFGRLALINARDAI